MNDLIKALQIFAKYGNPQWPTCCEHDVLYVLIDPSLVSEEDKTALDALGFSPGEDEYSESFYSYKFGAA